MRAWSHGSVPAAAVLMLSCTTEVKRHPVVADVPAVHIDLVVAAKINNALILSHEYHEFRNGFELVSNKS